VNALLISFSLGVGGSGAPRCCAAAVAMLKPHRIATPIDRLVISSLALKFTNLRIGGFGL
jgi:hypothetical protein